ncbi:MAG: phage holin family protein [Acidimicrobiia bacterium]|nr:phage holin family protein [Acidimicrobiia bacterium]
MSQVERTESLSMPESAAPGSGPGGSGFLANLVSGEWPTQAADTVERVVGQVRTKTTGPLIVASRAVVYGIVAAVLGIVAVILALVALVRLLDVVLPAEVWLPYLILGGIFVLVGMVLWRKRRS